MQTLVPILIMALVSSSLAAPIASRATSHSNTVSLIFGTSGPGFVQSVSFSWSGQYVITGGQPWGGVTSSVSPSDQVSELLITAQAGRKDDPASATWFTNQCTAYLGADADSNGPPSKLNFAFTGTLNLNGNSYDIVIGQGSNAQGNNWWIGGAGWAQSSNEIITSPDGAFTIQINWSPTTNIPYANDFALSATN